MTFFLLFLLIVFVVAPLVSAIFKMWSFRRHVRRFMEDPFGQADRGRTTQDFGQQQHQYHRGRHGKKIPHDVGEYVAFTEYETPADRAASGSSGRKTRTESQITDVEWVDIDK